MKCQSKLPSIDSTPSNTILSGSGELNVLHGSIPLDLQDSPVYAYIVATLKTDSKFNIRQVGSAPNFDGGRITLCTCKHKDRATMRPMGDGEDPWKGAWVAGFTSNTKNPPRALAFLMRVERSFLNQRDLWIHLPESCQKAKSATNSIRGDLFEPKPEASRDPHDPANYHEPRRGHVHASSENSLGWHRDIAKWGARQQPHRLLLGEVNYSFRWEKAEVILKPDTIGYSAHHRRFESLREFLRCLQEFRP